VFVDCDAINVETVHQIALIIGSAGARFVDCGIIGPPPGPQGEPTFYFSGADAARLGRSADDLGIEERQA